MAGWVTPPPVPSSKTAATFRRGREAKVAELRRSGLLRSARIERALLTVPREAFIPSAYREYAYEEVPLPLPGARATISCPHSYPLFYEPLRLDSGHRFLEERVKQSLVRLYGPAVLAPAAGQQEERRRLDEREHNAARLRRHKIAGGLLSKAV